MTFFFRDSFISSSKTSFGFVQNVASFTGHGGYRGLRLIVCMCGYLVIQRQDVKILHQHNSLLSINEGFSPKMLRPNYPDQHALNIRSKLQRRLRATTMPAFVVYALNSCSAERATCYSRQRWITRCLSLISQYHLSAYGNWLHVRAICFHVSWTLSSNEIPGRA